MLSLQDLSKLITLGKHFHFDAMLSDPRSATPSESEKSIIYHAAKEWCCCFSFLFRHQPTPSYLRPPPRAYISDVRKQGKFPGKTCPTPHQKFTLTDSRLKQQQHAFSLASPLSRDFLYPCAAAASESSLVILIKISHRVAVLELDMWRRQPRGGAKKRGSKSCRRRT